MSLRDGVLILSDKVSGLGDIFWKLHWETSLGPWTLSQSHDEMQQSLSINKTHLLDIK